MSDGHWVRLGEPTPLKSPPGQYQPLSLHQAKHSKAKQSVSHQVGTRGRHPVRAQCCVHACSFAGSGRDVMAAHSPAALCALAHAYTAHCLNHSRTAAAAAASCSPVFALVALIGVLAGRAATVAVNLQHGQHTSKTWNQCKPVLDHSCRQVALLSSKQPGSLLCAADSTTAVPVWSAKGSVQAVAAVVDA